MKKKFALFTIISLAFLSCNQKSPTQFSRAALNEQMIALDGETVTFESILEKHEGKTILITIWATWCRDCNEELPRIKAFQQQNNDVDYVFLSLDRSIKNWKKGIQKFDIKGDHYFMPLGWDGPFVDFMDLDWITRYMVINPQGGIKVFKGVKVNSKDIRESLTN